MDDVAHAHAADLASSGEPRRPHLREPVDEPRGRIFRYANALDALDARRRDGAQVHREAPGIVADEISRVRQGD